MKRKTTSLNLWNLLNQKIDDYINYRSREISYKAVIALNLAEDAYAKIERPIRALTMILFALLFFCITEDVLFALPYFLPFFLGHMIELVQGGRGATLAGFGVKTHIVSY